MTQTTLPTVFQSYIHMSRYSRYNHDLARRETWEETVDRWVDFFSEHIDKITNGSASATVHKTMDTIRDHILSLDVMPSMRTMMTAGPALSRDHIAAYNCSFLAINRVAAFDELLYVLMCGTGVGFSVERQFVSQLPVVGEEFHKTDIVIKVQDSKLGWAKGLKELISLLYTGQIPSWDVSAVRPAGAPLMTFGGRASGPAPLVELFEFAVSMFKKAAGRKLSSLEAHDLVCKIADIVVVGGVRRSALISLSNLSDDRMRSAKSGQWWETHGHRRLANNSAAYTEKPEVGVYMDEWKALYDSKSGERGIFNRMAAKAKCETIARNSDHEFGTNPCVTGDTLIAVADGRGVIPIRELAEAGLDVPVYSVADDGKIVVRKMRRPRKTGTSVPVFEVKFAEGGSVKATANHQFLMKSGEYVRVDQLVKGDQFELVTRFKDKLWKYKNSALYWHWKLTSSTKDVREHSIVSTYYNGTHPGRGFVVHHRDFNSLNNNPVNLQIMTKVDHDKLHSDLIRGDNNPMRRAQIEWSDEKWTQYRENMSASVSGDLNGRYSGVTNEKIKERALALTKKIGARFSTGDWCDMAKKEGYPQYFTDWRRSEIGTVTALSRWAANELGMCTTEDPRIYKKIKSLLDQGYDVEYSPDAGFIFTKECECCSNEFKTSLPEVSFCSLSCSSKKNAERRDISAETKAGWEKKHVGVRMAQLDMFTELRQELGSIPEKRNWQARCKVNQVSAEVSRPSSPFTSWQELKEAASSHNHRVESVTYVGEEDVYNGTVDDYHNFLSQDVNNEQLFFTQKQCGEILLRDREFCNLSEVVIKADDTEEDLMRKVELAAIIGTFQSTLTDFKYISKKWQQNCEEERLLGVSLTGIMDNPLTNGKYKDLPKLLARLRTKAREVNKLWAGILNVPPSAAITCVKPSGCTTLDTKIRVKDGNRLRVMAMADIIAEATVGAAMDAGEWLEITKDLYVLDENDDEKRITKMFINGLAEVYEITGEDGKVYKFTGEHKLKTVVGWKRVDELVEGDDIVSWNHEEYKH